MLKEIIELIATRDGISFSEAEQCVEECREELFRLLSRGMLDYVTATDIVEDYLGLEPDYLDVLLLYDFT